jgi:hypothetical protein
VLQTPVTSAPKCLASCSAAVPTPPEAPLISTLSPLRIFVRLKNHNAVVPPNEKGGRFVVAQVRWLYLTPLSLSLSTPDSLGSPPNARR